MNSRESPGGSSAHASHVSGVVLCGGHSSRMGRDKGLIERNGIPWARIIYDSLSLILKNVLVSIREEQRATYEKVFSSEVLIGDSVDTVQGPMRGLISSFLKCDTDILLVGCDMPDLRQSLSHLLQLREENPDYDCLAYRTARVEPLCAIYGKNILKQLRDHHPETFSLERLLERSRTLFIQADENETAELRNYNEPGPAL